MPKSGCSTCCCHESRQVSKDRSHLESGRGTGPHRQSQRKTPHQLRAGKLDQRLVELEIREHPAESGVAPGFRRFQPRGNPVQHTRSAFRLMESKSRKRRMRVDEAADYIMQEEEQKLVDMEQVARIALERVEQSGIIFLDEIDKIAGRESGHGPDVSREGVQRDILPIIEGTTRQHPLSAWCAPTTSFSSPPAHFMYRNPRTLSRSCRADFRSEWK